MRAAIALCLIFWGLVIWAILAFAGGMNVQHQRGTPTPFHPSNARDGVIEVWDSDGGYMQDFREDIRASLDAGYEIKVRGSCRSACTQIAGPEFRGFVRTGANPSGQIDIDPRRTAFGVHQISQEYGEKDLPATAFYLGTFPQEALERARVPDAHNITNAYHQINGRTMLDAIENMQRDGSAPVYGDSTPRRGLIGGRRE